MCKKDVSYATETAQLEQARKHMADEAEDDERLRQAVVRRWMLIGHDGLAKRKTDASPNPRVA